MDNQEKSKFIADSIASVVERHTDEFRKNNKSVLENIQNAENNDKFIEFMAGAVAESLSVMKEWEEKNHEELGGITAMEYYDSLEAPEDIIGLLSMLMEEKDGLVSASLEQRILRGDIDFSQSILKQLESLEMGEDGRLNGKQRAALYIAELIKEEAILEPLDRALLKLDDEKVDREGIETIMGVYRAVGQPSVKHLIDVVEKREMKGVVYGYSLITLAGIASQNKSEEMYKYLKDIFRKSDPKFIEANALGAYGDGRAVAAVRSHVERNLEIMDQWMYSQFREIIQALGGMVSDLDVEYSHIMGMHQHMHEHHHHEHHEHHGGDHHHHHHVH